MKIIIGDNEQALEVRKATIIIGDSEFRIYVDNDELVVNKANFGKGEGGLIIKPSVSNQIKVS